jgi:hypothetical protein
MAPKLGASVLIEVSNKFSPMGQFNLFVAPIVCIVELE